MKRMIMINLILLFSVIFLGMFLNTKLNNLQKHIDEDHETIMKELRVIQQDIYTYQNGWEKDK